MIICLLSVSCIQSLEVRGNLGGEWGGSWRLVDAILLQLVSAYS